MKNPISIKPHVHVVSPSVRLTGALSDRLARAGYAVSTGGTETEAATRVTRRHIEALICHVRGNGTSAFDLLERLKQQGSDACVLLVGPHREPEQVAGLVRSGAFDYLTLPIRPGKLEASLRQGLNIVQRVSKVRAPSTALKATYKELARERDALRRWNHNLTVVNQLSQAISGTLNAEEIISIAARRLGQLLTYDLVGVAWWRPERVWVQTCTRMEPERVAATRSALLARRRTRNGVEGGPSLATRRKATGTLASSHSRSIELPLIVDEEEQGLIRLERDQGVPFSPDDSEFLTTLAPAMALALRNAEVHSHVQNLAMTDGLTGLLNRRAFADHLARALRTGERYRSPTCLVMADLDHFKNVNDRFGHPAGDRLLKEVAHRISGAVRSVDVVSRYGGEEFAIILPHTELDPARVLAERIRKLLERQEFVVQGERARITASLGVARIPCVGISKPEEWLAAADQALYRAKTAGRNQVAVSEGLEDVGHPIATSLYAISSG